MPEDFTTYFKKFEKEMEQWKNDILQVIEVHTQSIKTLVESLSKSIKQVQDTSSDIIKKLDKHDILLNKHEKLLEKHEDKIEEHLRRISKLELAQKNPSTSNLDVKQLEKRLVVYGIIFFSLNLIILAGFYLLSN